jgi:hypothetical protein
MKIEHVAQICHEANRAYCATINDKTQLPWDAAPQWQRDSAVNGVRFHLANPTAGPSGSHESWLKEKKATGWKYGPVKSPEQKEHPCMVAYSALPAEQQIKDFIFSGIVHSVAQFTERD